jgi:hypothetical protein
LNNLDSPPWWGNEAMTDVVKAIQEGNYTHEHVDAAVREIIRLRAALSAYVTAQSKMAERWSEGDADVRKELWGNLHSCEHYARTLLPADAAKNGKKP